MKASMATPFLLGFALFSLGCGDDGPAIGLDPQVLDWGWVDFHTEECMSCECPEGCSQTEVALTNLTDGDLNVTMGGFDTDHICLDGFTSGGESLLGDISPGSRFLFKVSACGYQSGELNLENQEEPAAVDGSILFFSDASDQPLVLSWSFYPYRDQGSQGGGDTGS